MAFFRRTFSRRLLPDRFQEITERVYVFDCCLTTKELSEEGYKPYMDAAVVNLQKYHPGASFMVFNFKEGEEPSILSDILMEHEMTVVDYPRDYEGYPILPLEMINYFLRSSESWLSLEGQRNVILMHCERGCWPVLAFMLAGLLLYSKKQNNELKTLEMVYKHAPKELLTRLSSINPQASQLRYLQYISRRSLTSDWPPSDSPLAIESILLMNLPLFDGGKGCRPVIHIYGQDPAMRSSRSPRLLFSSLMLDKGACYYDKGDCLLVKIKIDCRVQGDVLLECAHLGEDLVSEEKMFKILFHTAFVQSYILVLGPSEVDVLWNANSRITNDFKSEVLFCNPDEIKVSIAKELASVDEGQETEIEYFEAEEFALSVSKDRSIDNLVTVEGLVAEINDGKEVLQSSYTAEDTRVDHPIEVKQEKMDYVHLDYDSVLMSREVVAVETIVGKETLQVNQTMEDTRLDHDSKGIQVLMDDTTIVHYNDGLMIREDLVVAIESNDGTEALQEIRTTEDTHLAYENEGKQESIDGIYLDQFHNNLIRLAVKSTDGEEILQANYTMEDTHLDHEVEGRQETIDVTHLDLFYDDLINPESLAVAVESTDGTETLQANFNMVATHLDHEIEGREETIDVTHLDHFYDNLISREGLEVAVQSTDGEETLQANYTMKDTHLDHEDEGGKENIDVTHLDHSYDNLINRESLGVAVESTVGKETLQASYNMVDTHLDHEVESREEPIDVTHLDHFYDNLISREGLAVSVESTDVKEILQANYTMEGTHLDHSYDNSINRESLGVAVESAVGKETLQANYKMVDTRLDHEVEGRQETINGTHPDHFYDNLINRESPAVAVESTDGKETLQANHNKAETHLDHEVEGRPQTIDSTHLDHFYDNLMSPKGLTVAVESTDGKETVQANYNMEDTHLDHEVEGRRETTDDTHPDHFYDNLISREGLAVAAESTDGKETLQANYNMVVTHLDHEVEGRQETTDDTHPDHFYDNFISRVGLAVAVESTDVKETLQANHHMADTHLDHEVEGRTETIDSTHLDHFYDNLISPKGLKVAVESTDEKETVQANYNKEDTHLHHFYDNVISREVLAVAVESTDVNETLQTNYNMADTYLDHEVKARPETIDDTHLDHFYDNLISREGLTVAVESTDGKETVQANSNTADTLLHHEVENKQETIDGTHPDLFYDNLTSREGLAVAFESTDGKETLQAIYNMEDTFLDHKIEGRQETIDDSHLDYFYDNLNSQEGLAVAVESTDGQEILQANYKMENTFLDHEVEGRQDTIDGTHLDHFYDNLISPEGLAVAVESTDEKETLQANYKMEDTLLDHEIEGSQDTIDDTHLDHFFDNLISREGLAVVVESTDEKVQANYNMENTHVHHQNEEKQETINGTQLDHFFRSLSSRAGLAVALESIPAGKETLQVNYKMEDAHLHHQIEDKQDIIDGTHVDHLYDNLISRGLAVAVESTDAEETFQGNYSMEDTHLHHQNKENQQTMYDFYLDHTDDNLGSRESLAVMSSDGKEMFQADCFIEDTQLDHQNEDNRETIYDTDLDHTDDNLISWEGLVVKSHDGMETIYDTDAISVKTVAAVDGMQNQELVAAFVDEPTAERSIEAIVTREWSSEQTLEVVYEPPMKDNYILSESEANVANENISEAATSKVHDTSLGTFEAIFNAEEYDLATEVKFDTDDTKNASFHLDVVERSPKDGSETISSHVISRSIVVAREITEDRTRSEAEKGLTNPSKNFVDEVTQEDDCRVHSSETLPGDSQVYSKASLLEDGLECNILSKYVAAKRDEDEPKVAPLEAGPDFLIVSKNTVMVYEESEDDPHTSPLEAGIEPVAATYKVVEGSDHDSSEISSSEIEPENYLMSQSFISVGGSENLSEMNSSETGSELNDQANSSIIPVAQAALSGGGSEIISNVAKHITVVVVDESIGHDVKVQVQPKEAEGVPKIIVHQTKIRKKPRLADAVAKVTMQKRVLSMWVPRGKQGSDDSRNKAPAYKWMPKGPASTSEES